MAQNHLLYYPTCYEGAECTQNTICTGPLANQHSKDLIPFMVKQFGKKVFFVGSNYVWPKESNKNAKIWLPQAGGELLGEEYIPLGSSEFGPVLNKIREAKPNFIFSTVVGASDIAFHKQFKQEGFKVDSMPIASLTTGEIETRAMGNEFGAGHFLSAPYFQGLDNPTNQKFVEGFLKSKYGKNGITHYNMEETYLSAYVFKYGLEKAIAEVGYRRGDAARDPRQFRWHQGRRQCLAGRPDLDRRAELQHLAEAEDRPVPGGRQLQDREDVARARRARSVLDLSGYRQVHRRRSQGAGRQDPQERHLTKAAAAIRGHGRGPSAMPTHP